MNIQQFSSEFDTLLSSYSITPPLGLTDPIAFNEYEKSVFLTKAQDDLIVDLYSGRNTLGLSFESSEEARRYLADLVQEYTESISPSSTEYDVTTPKDLWFITYEECKLDDESLGCLNGKYSLVIPIREDELYKTKRNPFRGPSEKRVLRVDVNNIIRLLSKYKISEYHCYYVNKPTPIILTDIGELNISGYSKPMECTLNSNIHNLILETAVRLALMSKAQYVNNENK
jgi:hypothetical protein